MRAWPWEKHNRNVRRTRTAMDHILERDIKRVIEEGCEKMQVPYMRNRDIKLIKTPEGFKFVPIGDSQLGKPDLTVVLGSGRTIWIETKSGKGELSSEQIEWRNRLQNRGHEYYAPHTVDEAHA